MTATTTATTYRDSGTPAHGPGLASAGPDQNITHYAVTAVPTVAPDEQAAAARERLTGRRFDDASHVFVVDGERRLLGVIAVASLIAADAATPVATLIAQGDCPVVAPDTDREHAASIAIHCGGSALAVCDGDGRLVGAVPAGALMEILRDEHLEDLHHMAGILGKSEAAKQALTAPPHRRALYRMPWLLVGMAGSALATAMMTQFETALASHIAVAFFIPAIVYLADAVGTQSEAVAVRGLSLTGARLVPLLTGELGTGVLIGAALACLAFPLVWIAFGGAALAATVAIALLVASSIATTVGLLLPWVFAQLGYDPALGSGPIATVLQDVLSLTIYFLVAAALLF
jgi:magnesium transporter